ncbi:protein NDRG3-like isoform X3 [Dreissena polymorpha]|uniref:protein NDRG3-like isoform X3 n=1 Tax=Dreissena polymorpha TaxID=45954 RepID=UPI002263F2AA|nr:protein NDRG3-like isoform X3 [Dreissena polymorpha]
MQAGEMYKIYTIKFEGEIMEHNALLDPTFGEPTSPMEKITHIELTGIQCEEAKPRSFNTNSAFQSYDVETSYGTVHVAMQGDKTKPAIFTYHDIGLNHVTCFQGFFNYIDMQAIMKHFCVYHVNAPGMHEGAINLSPTAEAVGKPEAVVKRFVYPTMDELAESVLTVADYFEVKRFIGFGVGSGANVLTRFALTHPTRVDSLVLVNATSTKPGWIEWGYQKMNSWYLWSGQITNFTEEYLLWHWFGSKTRWVNHDLVHVYKDYIKSINPQNLSFFIESYLRRTDLNVMRELDPIKKATTRTVKCRSLMLVGDDSPHMDDVVDMNGRMNPEETDFMKIADCGGMPLEEQPGKVCEAFRLFLQGMGYIPTVKSGRVNYSPTAAPAPAPVNNNSKQPVNNNCIRTLDVSEFTSQSVC